MSDIIPQNSYRGSRKGGLMKFALNSGLFAFILFAFSSCAVAPKSTDTNTSSVEHKNPTSVVTAAKSFTENPGDVKFEHPTADIMYKVVIACGKV